MSIYVSVGSETICVSGEGGWSAELPVPGDVLEREIASSRARQLEAKQLAFARSSPLGVPAEQRATFRWAKEPAEDVDRERLREFAPIDEADLPVAERAYAAGRAAGLAAAGARGPSRDALRKALAEAVEHCEGHMRDYHHETTKEKLEEWRGALSADARATEAAAAAMAASPGGPFVERKPKKRVHATRWSGDNLGEVSVWLATRVDSVKVDPDDANVLIAWDDDGRMRCRAPGWFVQREDGTVHLLSDDNFVRLYEPVPAPDDSALGDPTYSKYMVELARWRRWASSLVKEPWPGPGHDETLRKKISAVVEAPSVIEVDDDPPHGKYLVEVDLDAATSAVISAYCDDDASGTSFERVRAVLSGWLSTASSLSSAASELVVEACARVANDVYREALNGGEMPKWDDATPAQREVARETVRAALAGVSPAQWHAKWRAELISDGWRYDPIKSDDQKLHPNLVPYGDLPAGQRALDSLFVVAVNATSRALALFEAASFAAVPVLKLTGEVLPEQFAEFRRQWERQVAAGTVAWKTPIMDAPAQVWVKDPFAVLDARGEAARDLSPAKLRELFEEHCECRPVNTARESHSHDCDTDVTDDVRTLLHHVVMPEPGEMIQGELRPSTMQEEITACVRLSSFLAKDAGR